MRWMKLEPIIQSEVSQKEKQQQSILTHIYGNQGEGNGTPLQHSCLENPIDGGAWWAAVHGVAKSRTQLSNFTFTFHFHASEKEMNTPVFLPGESQGRGSLMGCRLWGRTELDMTEATQQQQQHGIQTDGNDDAICEIAKETLVSHPHVFFGEMSIQLFGPFFDWVIYFSGIELHKLLVYF